jgi:hypothetical protein
MVVAITVCTSVPTAAQTIPHSGDGQQTPGFVDCTDVSIEYQEDPTLTISEQIARMDAALLNSLSKFDACQSERDNAQTPVSAGGAEAGGSASGGGASVASSDMAGTEAAPTAQSDESASSWSPVASTSGGMLADELPVEGADNQVGAVGNGKIPDDIPPADNDGVLEAQIRQAAMNEKDPVVQEKLWNEYRKYKGLPQKN